MLALIFILAALLALFAAAFVWLDRRQRLENARDGIQNPRGRKLLYDEASLCDAAGNPVLDWFYLTADGGPHSCIGSWELAYLCEGEVLRLRPEKGRDIRIYTNSGRWIGTVPQRSECYEQLLRRLEAGQTVNAWVEEWGARRRFYCVIKLEVYRYPDDETASEGLPAKLLSGVVFFPAHDLNAVRRFYVDELRFTSARPSAETLLIDTGYGCIGFVDYGDDQPPATGCCISLNCNDRHSVDLLYSHLRERYIVLQEPGKHPVFPVYSFFMNDPTGYTLEIRAAKG